MNEPAIRLEEQMLNLFPERETRICHGWVLKQSEEYLCVYPLYYKFSDRNISTHIEECEEISRRGGRRCVFRIVEHTNYYLSSLLAEYGYRIQTCGVIGELCLTNMENQLHGECVQASRRELFLKNEEHEKAFERDILLENGEHRKIRQVTSFLKNREYGKARQRGLFLKREKSRAAECVMAGPDKVIGIKQQELFFLWTGNLPKTVPLEEVLWFSLENRITHILADIPGREDLPEEYVQAGFNRAYLYRCYEKEWEDLENGFTE